MTVSIVRNDAALKRRISDALKFIDFKLTKKRILLKPNLVVPAKPNSGIITSPEVIVALAEVLREEYGAGEILVGDGPGIPGSIERCFEMGGYKEAQKEHDLTLIDFDKVKKTKISWKYGTIEVPEFILDCCYVNVPKIKTHSQTTVTLSLKNQKGLLSKSNKNRIHKLGLHEPIAEFYRIIKPDLVVVDGLVGIEGDGPIFEGKRRRLDLIIAGTNALEVDEVCCRVMGIPFADVKHLQIAKNFTEKYAEPEIRGTPIEELNIRPFERANEILRKIGKVYYWKNVSACTLCSGALTRAIISVKKKPSLMIRYGPRIFYHILIKRLDLLMGKDAEIPPNHGEICCIGNCVAPLAKKHNLKLVRGCPPEAIDILKEL